MPGARASGQLSFVLSLKCIAFHWEKTPLTLRSWPTTPHPGPSRNLFPLSWLVSFPGTSFPLQIQLLPSPASRPLPTTKQCPNPANRWEVGSLQGEQNPTIIVCSSFPGLDGQVSSSEEPPYCLSFRKSQGFRTWPFIMNSSNSPGWKPGC